MKLQGQNILRGPLTDRRFWLTALLLFAVLVPTSVYEARRTFLVQGTASLVVTKSGEAAREGVTPSERFSMIAVAAALATATAPRDQIPSYATPDATLADIGARREVRVSVSRVGTQWVYYYDQPRIDIEVLGFSARSVNDEVRRATVSLKTRLAELQSTVRLSQRLVLERVVGSTSTKVLFDDWALKFVGLTIVGAGLVVFAASVRSAIYSKRGWTRK